MMGNIFPEWILGYTCRRKTNKSIWQSFHTVMYNAVSSVNGGY